MRTVPRLCGTLVVLLSVSLLPTATLASAADPPHVDVVADELPEGPAPAPSRDGSRFIRPDGSSVEIGGPKWEVRNSERVRGGFLVSAWRSKVAGEFVERITRVPDRGEPRTVLRQVVYDASYWDLTRSTVSADGRLIAMFNAARRPDRARLLVMRTSDGRTVAVRKRFRADVLAIQGRRVLELRDPATRGGRRDLVWWNVDTGRTTLALRTARSRIDPGWFGDGYNLFAGAAAANLSTGQVALPRGAREVVRPIPGQRGRTWHTDRSELVQSWSPDDRYVLTALSPHPVPDGTDTVTATLRIRRAAAGAVVAEFRGLVGVDTEFHNWPTWESADTFLTRAWSSYGEDPVNDQLVGYRQIRCSVGTVTCEALPD